ncbi:hypothetical protein L7F22_064248 [Adiantum nelumboides]|nr:hypothetical protein [Adiantum nelumboides]
MMSKWNSTMLIEHEQNMKEAMGGFNCEYIQHAVGSHNTNLNEDFFIGDLSEFSIEDIGAPIKNDHASSLQQHSDDTSAFTMKSECNSAAAAAATTTTHTSSPGSNLLQNSTLDFKAALLNEFQDSSLSLPCQDETGFEWLTSLGEDDLCNGSNFGMESFLLSNAETFGDYDIQMMKHGEYEDAIKVREMTMGQNSTSSSSTLEYEQPVPQENRKWDDDVSGLKSYNATNFVSHATGSRSARSKRARSSGWSSGSILCRLWPESPSPTESLNSTSQSLMPTDPQYSSTPSFLYKPEDAAYTTTSHAGNMDINFTPRLHSNSDQTLQGSNKESKFSPISKHWPKEEDNNITDESVSNYGSGLQPRRCTHCLSQKTPQWRAGPEGPKTLCNACGVRYKSGRLFDEYRPAKSPTFLSYKHSNSHKKVMEMRRRKVFQYSQQQQTHHVRAPAAKQAAYVHNQYVNSKLKVKLNSPPHSELPASTHFSDVTLISIRNALEGPSSFLY